MRSKLLAGILFGMAALLVAGYSGAGAGSDSMTADEGRLLYQKNCSGCHGNLETSAKGGRSMNRIRTAVRTLRQHKQFESLSDGQILLIAMVLRDVEN